MLAEFSHATAKSQNSSELELCVEHVGHHGKVMAKSWQSHGKVMAKSWQSHGKVMAM